MRVFFPSPKEANGPLDAVTSFVPFCIQRGFAMAAYGFNKATKDEFGYVVDFAALGLGTGLALSVYCVTMIPVGVGMYGYAMVHDKIGHRQRERDRIQNPRNPNPENQEEL